MQQLSTMNKIDRALMKLFNVISAETLDTMPAEDLAQLICMIAEIPTYEADDVESRVLQVREYRDVLRRLKAVPLIAQRTEAWYELRKQRLTASDTAQAIGKSKFGSREQLVQKKALELQGKVVPFKTMPAMKWGTMFEDMAMRCYQQRNENVSVYEFGLLPHPTLSCYGASPDGITELGIMTEIKCPFRRRITGEIPDYYELQMQGQMAVCGLKECDYIECDMEVFGTDEEYVAAVQGTCVDHGVICEFARDGETSAMYKYSDPFLNGHQALCWAREFSAREMKRDAGVQLVKLHMWRLRQISIQRVRFDPGRWERLVPAIVAFWDDVVKRSMQDVDGPSAAAAAGRTLDITEKRKYRFIADDDDE